MKEFLAMGGYAFYVWTSYGLALVVLLLNLVSPVVHRRKLLADIARKQRREKRSQPHRQPANVERASQA